MANSTQNKVRPLRSLGLYGATLLLTPSMGFVAGTSALASRNSSKLWWGASRTWASGILGAAGVTDLLVKGVEALYGAEPFILMANHQSHLDPPAIIRSSERPIGFLTKQELKRIPLFGWALERTGHVFIDRRHKDKAHASIDKAAARIAEGRCVAVFPEGTRTLSDDMLPFKKGGFVLALKAQVPIVPVGIAGTREIFPSQSPVVVGRGPVAVIYGPPIATTDYTIESKDALMQRVREAIVAVRDEARAAVAEHGER